MTTALVIGAGVAGPVTAMALQRAGIHAEVFEAHPTGADEVGSWLTLQANGIDALRAVDAIGSSPTWAIPRGRCASSTARARSSAA